MKNKPMIKVYKNNHIVQKIIILNSENAHPDDFRSRRVKDYFLPKIAISMI